LDFGVMAVASRAISGVGATIDDEDRELLGRPGRSDREAFARLYSAFVKRVEGWIRRGAGAGPRRSRADGDEVDDLVQEVFIRAFSAIARRRYDGGRPLGAYLHGIASHVLIDRARRSRREVLIDVQSSRHALEQQAETPEPSAAYPDPSALRRVEAFLAALPPQMRALHRERFVAGRSQRQAAAALGVSRQRLRTLEERLKDGVRDALGDLESAAPTRRS
jgi:RNA polymerase sigma factor (sigma-70 family)